MLLCHYNGYVIWYYYHNKNFFSVLTLKAEHVRVHSLFTLIARWILSHRIFACRCVSAMWKTQFLCTTWRWIGRVNIYPKQLTGNEFFFWVIFIFALRSNCRSAPIQIVQTRWIDRNECDSNTHLAGHSNSVLYCVLSCLSPLFFSAAAAALPVLLMAEAPFFRRLYW